MAMQRYSILTSGLSAVLAGAILLAGPASAKKKIVVSGPPIQMSDDFRANVQAAEAALKARDASTANMRIAALNPTTDFEAYAAAGLRFQTAVLRRDVQAQRIALTDMFKTSAVPKTDAPRLRFIAGYLSYVVGDYTDAVAQLDYARTLGYNGIDAIMLRADIAMRKNKPKDARPYVQEALALQKASGQPVPAPWYDRAISMAYQAGDWDEVSQLYRERLEAYPSTPEWRSALINYLAGQEGDAQVQLDLYRLQAANGAMASERDYQAYAQLAEKTGNYAEAKAIIEAGRAAGKLQATQATTAQLLKNVTPKATKDIAAMPALVKKAAAGKDGKPALEAADAYFSLGQYSQAVEQYRLALSKGGIDESRANARLGVALARSGDLTGAKTVLAQVTGGGWRNVAGFWSVWVDLQNRKSAQQASAQPVG